jgi:pyruvate/2-oxoglutarate dehydrogenase complex dihydrolipoamide acyltransferase (E2) component
MPLFRRSDGDLVKDLSDSRRIMPLVMRGRNESIVFHTMQLKVAKTRAWIREYNRTHGKQHRASLFYLFIYTWGKVLNERPGLNRFVAGGHIYQRKDVWISFMAKKRIVDDSPLVTVKLKFSADESFNDTMKRISDAVNDGRSGRDSPIEKELRVLTRLPTPILRIVIAAGRWLDRINLLPATFIEPDPLFSSLFLTNDGSVGIGNAHHHLYESGTCSIFAVVGSVKKTVVVDRGGHTDVQEVLEVGWSIDERINDGLYCASSLLAAQRLIEDPGRYISTPGISVDAGDAAAELSNQRALPQE